MSFSHHDSTSYHLRQLAQLQWASQPALGWSDLQSGQTPNEGEKLENSQLGSVLQWISKPRRPLGPGPHDYAGGKSLIRGGWRAKSIHVISLVTIQKYNRKIGNPWAACFLSARPILDPDPTATTAAAATLGPVSGGMFFIVFNWFSNSSSPP